MTVQYRTRNRRRSDLAAIHIAAKELALDRETYEALLTRVAGVTSAANLDADGRRAVRAELSRLAGPRKPDKRRERPHNLNREPMLQKIESLLASIHAPWNYADALARHMFGVERVAWLRKRSQLTAIIAALDARRIKLRQLAAAERDDKLRELAGAERDDNAPGAPD